jgi:hypothetical protein
MKVAVWTHAETMHPGRNPSWSVTTAYAIHTGCTAPPNNHPQDRPLPEIHSAPT